MPIHYHCSCPGISPQYSVQYQVHQVHHLAVAHVGSSSSSPPDRQRMSQKYLKTMWLLRVPSYKCTKHSQEFFWLLADCCAAKSGMHWKCRESKEKYMTSPGSGFCEDPRIPKKSYTRMAWWNLAHKMWPGHGVISCTLQDLRRSSHSSFADVLPVKPWIQITS